MAGHCSENSNVQQPTALKQLVLDKVIFLAQVKFLSTIHYHTIIQYLHEFNSVEQNQDT